MCDWSFVVVCVVKVSVDGLNSDLYGMLVYCVVFIIELVVWVVVGV